MYLLIVNNAYNEIDLAFALADTLDEEYILYLSNVECEEALLKIGERKNVKYTTDCDYIFLNGNHFKACFTFGCLSTFVRNHILNAVFAAFFKEIGIPVIDLQHGFYQNDINITDCGLYAGNKHGATNCIPLRCMAEYQIRWGGADGCGYLKSELDSSNINNYKKNIFNNNEKNYILIISNSHAKFYNEHERYQFIYTILHFISEHPELNYVVRFHKGEINDANSFYYLINKYKKIKNLHNITFSYNDDVSLPLMIYHSKLVVSTLTTAILSCEFLNISTFVFDPNNKLKNSINNTFKTLKDLNRLFDVLTNKGKQAVPVSGIERMDKTILTQKIKSITSTKNSRFYSIGASLKYIKIYKEILSQIKTIIS
jgi:hypothetical protein